MRRAARVSSTPSARPLGAEMVFATFQSLHPVVGQLDPQAFDMVVVDEAHHTAAVTHETVLSHLRPRWTMGLTATPFRGDGRDIGAYFTTTRSPVSPARACAGGGAAHPH